VIISYRSK